MKMETINVEYANNLISNTLLNSIKTGQPLIDALNSLIFLSGNKNKYLKSIIIVIILSFGILYKKYQDKYDYVDIIINKFNTHMNKNYSVLKFKVYKNSSRYETINLLYNFIALLYETHIKYPNTEKECFELEDGIYDTYTIMTGINNLWSNYDEYNKYRKNLLINLVLTNPPKSNKWYVLDNDIEFNWSINKTYKEEYNKDNQKTTNVLDKDKFYFNITLKSNKKTLTEINDYVDNIKNKVINVIINTKDDINNIVKNIKETNYTGCLYQLEPIEKQNGYDLKSISTFNRNMDGVFFSEKPKLLNILNNFKQKTNIYKKLDHRHKLGILLYGKPGCGKTTLATAIASYLKRDIITRSFKKDITNKEMTHLLSQYGERYIIVLDEIDSHKALYPRKLDDNNSTCSENTKDDLHTLISMATTVASDVKEKDNDSLNIGTFLELMDGISVCKNRVVIAITNHPNHLDPAILRPGRFDVIINLNSLDREHVKMYINYLLQDFETDEKDIDNACDYCEEHSISTAIIEQAILEKCSNTNLTLYDCIKNVNESFKNVLM